MKNLSLRFGLMATVLALLSLCFLSFSCKKDETPNGPPHVEPDQWIEVNTGLTSRTINCLVTDGVNLFVHRRWGLSFHKRGDKLDEYRLDEYLGLVSDRFPPGCGRYVSLCRHLSKRLSLHR